nr:internal virion protein B-like protein [uncultured Mediterranean phage uvMED]
MSFAQAFTVGMTAVQVKQQSAIGKYNQRVANRNADILEQEAGQIDKQAEFDIARFDQQFRKSVGTVNVALAKSGVDITSGSAARVKEANQLEAEMQNKITRYNADVSIANKMEEARFSRIQGEMARQQARLANISTVAKAGTSLLATTNFGEKSIFGSTPKSPFGNRSSYPNPLPGADD